MRIQIEKKKARERERENLKGLVNETKRRSLNNFTKLPKCEPENPLKATPHNLSTKNHDTLAKKTTETIFLYAKLELMTEVSSCCARPAASASAAAWFSDGEVLWQMQFRKEGNPNGLFSWGLKGLFFEVKIASLMDYSKVLMHPNIIQMWVSTAVSVKPQVSEDFLNS